MGLLGANGAAKTTVMNLLLRFLDPDAGEVALGSRDLRKKYRLADIRRSIAAAGQESHLFSTSIRDHVRLSRPAASDAEVEAAARAVGAHDFVAGLSGGYLHELAEPLTAITCDAGAARRLSESQGFDSQAKITDSLQHLLSEATRANEVIHRFLFPSERG